MSTDNMMLNFSMNILSDKKTFTVNIEMKIKALCSRRIFQIYGPKIIKCLFGFKNFIHVHQTTFLRTLLNFHY